MRFEALLTEDHIRERAYAIWAGEGCQNGRSAEYWARAKVELLLELERACEIMLATEEQIDLVMPLPPISKPPYRHEAGRIDPDRLRQAA